MIERLSLKNFAAFRNLEVSFSPKINVIIGENSCGKTQLLKAAYALTSSNNELSQHSPVFKTIVRSVLTRKLLGIYKPNDGNLGSLNHRGCKEATEIAATFSSGRTVGGTFTSRSNKVEPSGDFTTPDNGSGVFIPTKEVLSFLEGFASPESHRPTIEQLFDSTYFDLANKLLIPEQVREAKAQWAKEKITNRIGGRFEFDGPHVEFKSGEYKEYKNKHASETYFNPTAQAGFSATMTAEGFRKVGVLQRLLQNSAIGSGISGPLYWDEPEANMNPKLMRLVVEILFELSRNGQQIIIASHDYVLLKWLDLLADKGKEDHVRFHSLYRDRDTDEIKITSTDDFLSISPNPIDEAFGFLINQEITNDMGDLGK